MGCLLFHCNFAVKQDKVNWNKNINIILQTWNAINARENNTNEWPKGTFKLLSSYYILTRSWWLPNSFSLYNFSRFFYFRDIITMTYTKWRNVSFVLQNYRCYYMLPTNRKKITPREGLHMALVDIYSL